MKPGMCRRLCGLRRRAEALEEENRALRGLIDQVRGLTAEAAEDLEKYFEKLNREKAEPANTEKTAGTAAAE